MRKRRGAIHEAVASHFHKGTKGYVVIAERGTASGTKKISFEDIERVAVDRLILVDGTIIPLHRVLYIVNNNGSILWSRYGKQEKSLTEQKPKGRESS